MLPAKNHLTLIVFAFVLSYALYYRRIQQKIIDIYHKDSALIIVRHYNISGYDNSFKCIFNTSKGTYFLFSFIFIRKRICRLNIISGRTFITDKINLKLLTQLLAVSVSFYYRYHTYINVITSHSQFIIDNIFHRVRRLDLPEIYPYISEPKITEIVFLRSFDI